MRRRISVNNKPLISIIVPVYNVEQYLPRCLDSILAQTFTDFEVIAVDDGSPDNCGQILDEYAQKDERIKVIHKENGGVSSARNAALDVAQGEYIGFVDADDYVAPDMYKCLINSAKSGNDDITICGYYEVIDAEIKNVAICENEHYITSREGIIGLIKDDAYRGYLCNKLYKKELFDGVRCPEMIVMEDIYVNHILFKKAKNIHLLKQSLYYYVRRKDSVTMRKQTKTNVALYRYYTHMHDRLIDDFRECETILNTRKVSSAFKMLLGIDANKEMREYEGIYNEAYCFLKNNRELIENSLLSEGYRKRLKLFLFSRNLFFCVSRIYNIIVNGKNTFEYL